MLAATYLKELPFETLVRLLEKGYKDSPCHSIEAYPHLLSRTLRLEEVEENIHGWRMAKVVAENGKGCTKAQLLGCSWAGTTLISVKRARSNPVNER